MPDIDRERISDLLITLKAECDRGKEDANNDYSAFILSMGDVRLFYTVLTEYARNRGISLRG